MPSIQGTARQVKGIYKMDNSNKYTYNVTVTYKAGNPGHEYTIKRLLRNIPADNHQHAIEIARDFYRHYKITSFTSDINDADYIDDLEVEL